MNSRILIAIGLFAAIVGATTLHWYANQPHVVFLQAEVADWIVHDAPVELRAQPAEESVAIFRTFIDVERAIGTATLEFAALSEVTIYFAGRDVHTESGVADWSQVRSFPLGHHLRPGRHELAFAVRNQDGPVALSAACVDLDLRTDTSWEVNTGEGWSPARLATERPYPAPALGVPSGFSAWLSRLWVWLVAFSLAAGAVLGRDRFGSVITWISRPRNLQFVLLGLWGALALNNFWRLPLEGGFDAPAHVDYVKFILEHGALPLANDGWQMFQMPLFYLLAALPAWALGAVLDADQVQVALRLLPLACGALHIPVALRTLKAAFPDREDLQCLGITFVALLPMNVYMSQWVGNEPLGGLLSAVVLMQLIEILRTPELATRPRRQIWLGVTLATAVLTKVTAVLLIPVVVAVLILSTRGRTGLAVSGRVLVFFAMLAVWPFARNLFELGSAFVFSSSSVEWWQEPGYRVVGDLLHFGRALDRPVFASTSSFWNAVYSTFWLDGQMSSFVAIRWFPPWNLSFVLAGGWLGFPLSLWMITGGILGFVRRDPVVLLAVGCTALYLAALLQQFLALPIYSTAKATYTLGLLPLYAILLVAGIDPLLRGKFRRAIITGVIAGWAVFSYLGYFVV